MSILLPPEFFDQLLPNNQRQVCNYLEHAAQVLRAYVARFSSRDACQNFVRGLPHLEEKDIAPGKHTRAPSSFTPLNCRI